MDAHPAAESILRVAQEQLTGVVTRLQEADARRELLVRYEPPRKALLGTRAATMTPLARVWRLGVLLLDADGGLYATGEIIRAGEVGHPNNQSRIAEQRREWRAAAQKAGIHEGETVNLFAEQLHLEADALRESPGPLVLREAGLGVRWSAAAGDDALMPFAGYLDDRLDLLLDPPQGA